MKIEWDEICIKLTINVAATRKTMDPEALSNLLLFTRCKNEEHRLVSLTVTGIKRNC